MDDKTFRQIDMEMQERIKAEGTGWADPLEWVGIVARKKPPETELVPIGEYDGGELLPHCHLLDDSYVVYVEVVNIEFQ